MRKMDINLFRGVLALSQKLLMDKIRGRGIIVIALVSREVISEQRTGFEFFLKDVNLVQEQDERRGFKQLVVRDRVEQGETF